MSAMTVASCAGAMRGGERATSPIGLRVLGMRWGQLWHALALLKYFSGIVEGAGECRGG